MTLRLPCLPAMFALLAAAPGCRNDPIEAIYGEPGPPGTKADNVGSETGTSGSSSGAGNDIDMTVPTSSGGSRSDTDGMQTTEGLSSSSTAGEDPNENSWGCVDSNLHSADTPAHIDGSTLGGDNSLQGSCGGAGADTVYRWTAPAAGRYLFTTLSTATTFDTILYALDGCDGRELACNDDTGQQRSSSIVVTLEQDGSIVVVVDGYNSTTAGDYSLSILALPEEGIGGGNCCTVGHLPEHCDVWEVSDCTCAFDPFCCSSEWDASCVANAIDVCGVLC